MTRDELEKIKGRALKEQASPYPIGMDPYYTLRLVEEIEASWAREEEL